MRFRNIIYLLFFVTISFQLKSQQLPNYSQYMLNGFLINPAAAGADGYTAFNFTAREQWVGLQDAPRTHALSVQSRILKKSFISRSQSIRRKKSYGAKSGKIGYGAYIFNDRNGVISRTGIQATYSYHIRMDESQLSTGFSLLGYQFSLSDFKSESSGGSIPGSDPALANPNSFNIDANLGVLFMNPNFNAGASVSNLVPAVIQIGVAEQNVYTIRRHYNIQGGYIYRPDRYWKIEPSMLLKIPEGQKPQLDINTKFTYRTDYWGGLSYRTGSAMILFFGMKFDKYYFGYAFDYTLQSIGRYTYGSHEFFLAVKFGENAQRYRWLNRY